MPVYSLFWEKCIDWVKSLWPIIISNIIIICSTHPMFIELRTISNVWHAKTVTYPHSLLPFLASPWEGSLKQDLSQTPVGRQGDMRDCRERWWRVGNRREAELVCKARFLRYIHVHTYTHTHSHRGKDQGHLSVPMPQGLQEYQEKTRCPGGISVLSAKTAGPRSLDFAFRPCWPWAKPALIVATSFRNLLSPFMYLSLIFL